MLLTIYMTLTLIMGVSALWNGVVYAGIAGIVGPTLCWFAGSGLRGCFFVGNSSEMFAGLGAAIVFVAVGIGIVYHSGYWIGLFGYELTGVTWCLIGLLLGWAITKREHTV